ncbi:MAG: hypothetical protein AAF551_09780, partial [Bacteroidota bacterium]
NYKISLLGVLMILSIMSCDQTDIETQKVFQSNLENSTSITLDNGNIIRFQRINDGEIDGTFMVEESDCESCSVLKNLYEVTSEDLTESEVFWALSSPGTPIPTFLQDDVSPSGRKSTLSKEQGWGTAESQPFISPIIIARPKIACHNESFTGSIAGGFLGEPDFVRLDKTPDTYGPFIEDCDNVSPLYCTKGERYRYTATYSGITKWRGKICSKAVQNASNDHYLDAQGTLCNRPPCDAYIGPELYFEYKSGGKWKSMKNPDGQTPEGFEVPANSTRVYTYSWNTRTKTSFRLRVKNAMGKDQFDFMMDKEPQNPGGGGNPGGGNINLEDLPQVPDYISLTGNNSYRMIVDFTQLTDGKPSIEIPRHLLPSLPEHEGTVIFPNNFCGFKIFQASRIIWLDNGGQVLNNDVFNYIPEDESINSLYGSNFYLGGIQFSGPIGTCDKPQTQWVFNQPFTKSGFQFANQPAKLVIELEQYSQVEFLNSAIDNLKPLDALKIFKDVDFDKIIKYWNQVFNPASFEAWVERVCEDDPSECPLND